MMGAFMESPGGLGESPSGVGVSADAHCGVARLAGMVGAMARRLSALVLRAASLRGALLVAVGVTALAVQARAQTVAWTQRMVGGPSPRVEHAMAYDAARGVTVLFGGETSSGSYTDETWEWNGTAWTQRVISGPSARGYHAMAYDAARGVTVLFGGYAGAYNGQTWELGGTCGPADDDHNARVEPADVSLFVNTWYTSLINGTLAGDFDGNGFVQPADVSLFVTTWFAALTSGC